MNELVKIPTFESIDEAVGFLMQVRKALDNLQWLTGDFALKVEQDLGPGALEEVAKQSGVQIGTIRRYRDVAKIYSQEMRVKYPKLSWTHYRNAATTEKPEEWLEKADNDNWSCELLSVKINHGDQELPPPEPAKVQCVTCGGFYLQGPKICTHNGVHLDE
jgi:hypothetical protein